MPFVYLHDAVHRVYPVADADPDRLAGAIFLSTFVMIGQNRQSAFQQAKADHHFNEQELELKTNTELTRAIHTLTTELHRRLLDEPTR
jgi:uncharacterized membrane protein